MGLPILALILVALTARELGGGRFSELLAGLTTLLAPVFLITSAMIAVEGINTFWWAVCLYLAVRAVKEPSARRCCCWEGRSVPGC
jgi:dolichyl-phosphate-mannose--protein O-mannosyl transferase